ncbi:MBL-fold metallo-hydrolase superfamily [Saccharolobus shibatae B12]|uniref:MBL-fold metallo-hydrolase superfamily n=1 Tax=Saccharolobus shibatae (strain ATCC 51178 / DSM 5389 / JCM 8931 / NBRC 15437 / B12) TaxID=523848 RepID=A0A8F5BQD7_SACSH|nr:MBL fold metallo-hydrolase [Saccharolobus shibatae]QXJ29396.1 MBL-fold metallo-hydrolase superfamily [Saccharolobus shibatae B12]
MPESITKNLFKLSIKLPDLEIGSLNAYLLTLSDKNILIDTGSPSYGSISSLVEDLEDLGMKISEINEVIITHFHIDHIGLAYLLSKLANVKIIIGNVEYNFIKRFKYRYDEMIKILKLNGASQQLLNIAFDFTSGFRANIYSRVGELNNIEIVNNNQSLYNLRFLFTPGHTIGHMCIYDEENKLLLSGDTLLADITPNISLYEENSNPLSDYLKSLMKISSFEVKKSLSAHGRIIENTKERIRELIRHHEERLNEILEVMGNSGLTAYEIATKIKWKLKYDGWDELDPSQQYLAMGETLAHLKYLENINAVRTMISDGIIKYVKQKENVKISL